MFIADESTCPFPWSSISRTIGRMGAGYSQSETTNIQSRGTSESDVIETRRMLTGHQTKQIRWPVNPMVNRCKRWWGMGNRGVRRVLGWMLPSEQGWGFPWALYTTENTWTHGLVHMYRITRFKLKWIGVIWDTMLVVEWLPPSLLTWPFRSEQTRLSSTDCRCACELQRGFIAFSKQNQVCVDAPPQHYRLRRCPRLICSSLKDLSAKCPNVYAQLGEERG